MSKNDQNVIKRSHLIEKKQNIEYIIMRHEDSGRPKSEEHTHKQMHACNMRLKAIPSTYTY